MTEAPTSHDQEQFSKLKKDLTQRLLADTDTINFFGLKTDIVSNWTSQLLFDDNEIRVSPGFMSAGWGHNQSKYPQIEETDISTSVQNYLHESRHGLHNLVCETLFAGADAVKNLKLFKENVLGEMGFINQIDKPGGSPLQERMLKPARGICAKNEITVKEVNDIAWVLGALTYQHAYYVDPGMCEAAASYHDKGITLVVDEYNQWFAKLLIPGEQFFEGYANPEWQDMFKKADPQHKALLVKKFDYKREKYFKEPSKEMKNALARVDARDKNAQSYKMIAGYLDQVTENSLASKPTWTPEEASKIESLSKIVLSALPESVRSLTFPNGGKIIFGEENDETRLVAWDLMDIKKWAEHLKKTAKF